MKITVLNQDTSISIKTKSKTKNCTGNLSMHDKCPRTRPCLLPVTLTFHFHEYLGCPCDQWG